jgi:hypothetical protein
LKTLREWKCLDSDTGEDLADPPAFHFGAAREVRKYQIPDFSNWKKHDTFEAAFAHLEKICTPAFAEAAAQQPAPSGATSL